MINTRQIYSMSDFVRNPKAHVARMKESRAPEVLTVNGRAEVVVLDAETYENLMERLEHAEAASALRVHMAKSGQTGLPQEPDKEPTTEAEIERRHTAMNELVAETERLGLYR